MTKTQPAVTIYLDTDEVEMIDTIRKRKGVVWSRENMLHKALKEKYERDMAEPMAADPEPKSRADEMRDYWTTGPGSEGRKWWPTYSTDGSRFGPLAQYIIDGEGNVRAAGGWCAPVSDYYPGLEYPPSKTDEQRKIEAQAEAALESLHDLVDAVVELSAGPVTVTAEAPIAGGTTYRMSATIEFGVKPVFTDE